MHELRAAQARVDVHDPWADAGEAARELGITPIAQPELGAYDAIVLAVAHRQFHALGTAGVIALGKPGAAICDVKSALDAVPGSARL